MFTFKALVKLLFLRLKGVRFDIVSVHCTLEALITLAFKWFIRAPYVFVFEGYTDMEARAAKYADLQIAISKDIIEKCYKKYGYKPLLVPVGVDPEKYAVDGTHIRRRFCSDDEKLVVTVCRLDPRKDIPTLVSAAKIVCERDPKIKFIVVGDGIDRCRIERKIEELKLFDKIKIVRKVPVTPDYYRAGDIFVLPSLYEGFGIVFLEAMSAELPIISTTAKAIPEAVGDAGILIPPQNPKILAEKILQLISDDELRVELAKKGLQRVKEYDWKTLIAKYEKAYELVFLQ